MPTKNKKLINAKSKLGKIEHQKDFLPEGLLYSDVISGKRHQESYYSQSDSNRVELYNRYEDIKLRDQTRELKSHISSEITKASDDIKSVVISENISLKRFIQLTGVKIIQLLTLNGIMLTIFSLIISRLYGFHIVHPIVAIVILFSSSGFFLMSKMQISPKKSHIHR